MPAETTTTPEPAAVVPVPAEAPPATPVPAAAAVAAPSVVAPSPAPQPGIPNRPSQVTAKVPSKELGLKSIESPYVPISPAQQAQLDDLLAKYKANEITPVEYHKQRAEILAQHQP
jgi:hypothetical protein